MTATVLTTGKRYPGRWGMNFELELELELEHYRQVTAGPTGPLGHPNAQL
jgi:hypothetical protein